MVGDWPCFATKLEGFLTRVGLRCDCRKEDLICFGNKIADYSDAAIQVRLVSDRDQWFVEVGPKGGELFDACLIRDVLRGGVNESFEIDPASQFDFVRASWAEIVTALDPVHRKASLASLKAAGDARARRLFPGLFSDGGCADRSRAPRDPSTQAGRDQPLP